MNEHRYQNGFRKLVAWQEAHRLTVMIYQITENFPRSELYGITNQLRRAASSVGAQIAEGSRMPTQVHRKLYYDRAYASLAEVDNYLELALDLGHLTSQTYENLLKQLNKTSYLILQLIKSCNAHPLNPVST